MSIIKKKLQKCKKKLVCAYNSQDFAQTQENFARSQDRETMTFRNSGAIVKATFTLQHIVTW